MHCRCPMTIENLADLKALRRLASVRGSESSDHDGLVRLVGAKRQRSRSALPSVQPGNRKISMAVSKLLQATTIRPLKTANPAGLT